MGVIEGTPATDQRDGSSGTRHMMVRDPSAYSFAPAAGLFEPTNLVGETVRAGDPAGWLHFVEDVDHDPIEVRYEKSGVVWMCAGPGRVARGDVVSVIMTDYDDKIAAA